MTGSLSLTSRRKPGEGRGKETAAEGVRWGRWNDHSSKRGSEKIDGQVFSQAAQAERRSSHFTVHELARKPTSSRWALANEKPPGKKGTDVITCFEMHKIKAGVVKGQTDGRMGW